tara:strand:- start:1097 stop:1729 length:633 start_codon:yes stop_codon:yes gene_type:complete
MKQSYKIFINNIVIILAQHKQGFKLPKRIENITIYTINKLSNLQKLITAIEIGSITENLVILTDDLDWLQKNFLKSFKIVIAGGGLVTNSTGKVLMMYRKKKWDLPKGKIEKDESIKDGAVREIEEETGVKVLAIQQKLGKTYHTYKLKDKWVLKETHWYLMNGDDTSELVPETKEGIEKVEWCTKKEVKEYLKNSYVSIQDVFDLKKQV